MFHELLLIIEENSGRGEHALLRDLGGGSTFDMTSSLEGQGYLGSEETEYVSIRIQ